jgi:hypothetical protein
MPRERAANQRQATPERDNWCAGLAAIYSAAARAIAVTAINYRGYGSVVRGFDSPPRFGYGTIVENDPVENGGMPTHRLTNSEDEAVNEHVLELLREVVAQSHRLAENDSISNALLYFLVRVANTWRSIRTLRAHTSDGEGFMVDAGVLLRAMFDAYLQAEHIVYDPARQYDRAKAYLDFEHVERYKASARMTGHNHPISDRLKSSPERPEGDKRLQENYDRVKSRFFVKKHRRNGTVSHGSTTRDKWYSGDLRSIATALGQEAEYDYFVATFHGCVHSSAFAVHLGPPVSAEYVLHWASTIAARVARLNVQYNRIDLGEFRTGLLERLCRDYGEAARSAASATPR